MTPAVKIADFEGPLDLLLELIERDRLDITELSLAKITEKYLRALREQEAVPAETLADFLVVASRLMLLKSRTLLPSLRLGEEEEEDEASLTEQLAVYRLYREQARRLREGFARPVRLFARECFAGQRVVFAPPAHFTPATLAGAMQRVVQSLPDLPAMGTQVVRRVISLQQKMEELRRRLQQKMEANFHDFLAQARSRMEAIVAFLALLELIKQQIVQVEQTSPFGSINVKLESNVG